MIVELLAGDNLRIVVIIGHSGKFITHFLEGSSQLGAVTFLKIASNEVSGFDDDFFSLGIGVTLLDVVGINHVFKRRVGWLSDVSNGSESFTVMVSGRGNGLRITHFHLAGVNVGLTYYFKKQHTKVKYRNV
jgi:hypothetical protein